MNDVLNSKTISNAKDRVINSGLLFGFILGYIAVGINLTDFHNSEFKFGYLIDFLSVSIYLLLYLFRNKISTSKKVYITMAGIFIMVFIDMYNYSIFADNKILLLLIPLLSYLVLSFRKAIFFSTVSILPYLSLGYLFNQKIIFTLSDLNLRATKPNAWIVNIILLIIISIIIIILINEFNKVFLKLINNLKNKNEQLESYQDKLEEMVAQKTADLKETNEKLNQTIKDLKDTQAHLIQSDKMASIGILTSGIAHEINNPLNYIQGGYTSLHELIKEGNYNNDDLLKYLEFISTGVERTTSIIKSLEHFNENSDDFNEICNINEIINNCLTVLSQKTNNKIILRKSLEGDYLYIKGNNSNLHQVFLNILLNSTQAITEKGTVSIITKKSEKFAKVVISDSGSGISQENINKVTDPFYTTKAPGKGAGLGLSIAYSIVKKHGGNLEISSILGKGTSITITLPTCI